MSHQTVSHSHRLELLARSPIFGPLPAILLEHLAKTGLESTYKKGDTLVTEGDIAHSLFIMVRGEAIVTQRNQNGTIEVGHITSGDVFGEMGLLAQNQLRKATVVAKGPCTVLKVNKSEIDFLSQEYPFLKKNLFKIAEAHELANALKRNAYFSSLDSVILRELARRVQNVQCAAGKMILHQEDPGDSCFYVKSGEVEVYRMHANGQRETLGRLGTGEIFGEAAALTGQARNANVVAVQATELLVITKAELSDIMSGNKKVARSMINLLFLRNMPQKSDQAILKQNRETQKFILQHPTKAKSLTLDEEELFLWNEVDGTKNLRELTLAFHRKFGVFVPQRVSDILNEFTSSEFLQINTPFLEFGEKGGQNGLWQKLSKLMEHKIVLHDVDETLTKLFNRFFFIFWSWPAQIVYLCLIVLGTKSFVEHGYLLFEILQHKTSLVALFLLLLPLFLVASLVHEMAHAFTVKKFGRTVLGIGIGWHWLGPAFFVDTSDLWTAPPYQRVIIRLVGLYANLILAGASSLILNLEPPALLGQILWVFSLSSTILVLIYLNPMIKSYGYLAWREGRQNG